MPDLALLIVVAVLFTTRWAAVREIEVPLWGDSVQHAVMTQRISEVNGLFDSWEPYAAYESLTVHFGFAAAAAYLVDYLGSSRAVVETGQILNVFAVLALYPLALKISKGSRWAGVGAVITAGLLSPMPGFYTNWGRYAQLAGQVVMPTALWLLWSAVEDEKLNWRKISLAGIALAGMLLNYYRTPFYYGAFAAALLIGWGLPNWGFSRGTIKIWRTKIVVLGAVAAIGFILFLPWASNLLGGSLASFAGNDVIVTDDTVLSLVLDDYRTWLQLDRYLPWGLAIAALFSLVVAAIRKNWTVSLVGLWTVFLASIVATRLIGLPGANFMQNFSIIIMLYMPVGLLVGWLFGRFAGWVDRWMTGVALRRNTTESENHRFSIIPFQIWGQSALFILVLSISFVYAHSQGEIVNERRHALVTRPDMRAMAWISENTPENAVFLVQGFQIWQGYSVVGSDAGWWIPLLAGRQNTMPPQYALLNEAPIDPNYNAELLELIGFLDNAAFTLADSTELLCEWGITHIYQGQRQGEVGAAATPLFVNADLSAFPEIYHADRVRIHKVQCGEIGGE